MFCEGKKVEILIAKDSSPDSCVTHLEIDMAVVASSKRKDKKGKRNEEIQI